MVSQEVEAVPWAVVRAVAILPVYAKDNRVVIVQLAYAIVVPNKIV